MGIKYKHTNIVACDWKKLAEFYINMFGCTPVLPERHLSGRWLETGTGVRNAAFSGIHLLLPGFQEDGPTLEIYQYAENEMKPAVLANREGFGHIAFETEDVKLLLDKILQGGGSKLGDITSKEIDGVGRITFVYAKDPEGNIVELQSWDR